MALTDRDQLTLDELEAELTLARPSRLPLGGCLQHPVFDFDQSQVLLAAGTQITSEVLNQLESGGHALVRMHHLDFVVGDGPEGETAPPSDFDLTAAAASPNAFARKVHKSGSAPYDAASVARFETSCAAAFRQIDDLFAELAGGYVADQKSVETVTNQSLEQICEDIDLFVSLGIVPETDKYPSRHSYQSAMLATAIGTNCGLSEPELMDLATGSLLHDAGMLYVRQDLVTSPRKLAKAEFAEITKHPVVALDLLQKSKRFSTEAQLVVYQMHERFDGSGYPRQTRGRNIHRLAQVAAVADVFLALVSPRPHRPRRLPYAAVERIVKAAGKGVFNPQVVRGLLRTISLFPIGSFAEMSDGRVGRVIRANGDEYARPVLELWKADRLQDPPDIVDLVSRPELTVTRPLAELSAHGPGPA